MLQAGPIQNGLLWLNNELRQPINLIYEFFSLIFLLLFYEGFAS